MNTSPENEEDGQRDPGIGPDGTIYRDGHLPTAEEQEERRRVINAQTVRPEEEGEEDETPPPIPGHNDLALKKVREAIRRRLRDTGNQ